MIVIAIYYFHIIRQSDFGFAPHFLSRTIPMFFAMLLRERVATKEEELVLRLEWLDESKFCEKNKLLFI